MIYYMRFFFLSLSLIALLFILITLIVIMMFFCLSMAIKISGNDVDIENSLNQLSPVEVGRRNYEQAFRNG